VNILVRSPALAIVRPGFTKLRNFRWIRGLTDDQNCEMQEKRGEEPESLRPAS